MHVTELHKPLCLKRKGNFTPVSPAAFFPFFLHPDNEGRQRCHSSRPDMLRIGSPCKGPASPPRLLNYQQASLCFSSSLVWLLWSGFAYPSLPCTLIKFYRFQLSRNVERQKSNHLSTHLYPGVHRAQTHTHTHSSCNLEPNDWLLG